MQKATSLGKYLQSLRESQKKSLANLSSVTKIRKEVLANIESDDLGNLGSPVYAVGIVKSYAKALGADPDKVMALYRRAQDSDSKASLGRNLNVTSKFGEETEEFESDSDFGTVNSSLEASKTKTAKNKTSAARNPRSGRSLKNFGDFIYSRKFLFVLAGAIAVGSLVLYAAGQLSALFSPPKLEIVAPVTLSGDFSGEIFVAGNSFQLKGQTSPRTIVRMNTEPLEVEADSSFSTPEIPLRNDQFILSLSATNQFGRTTTINLTIKKGSPGIATAEKMSVLVEIQNDVIPLLIRADGKIQFDDRAFPGDIITLDAKARLQIETPTPGNVKLKINGEDFVIESINATWELIEGKVVQK